CSRALPSVALVMMDTTTRMRETNPITAAISRACRLTGRGSMIDLLRRLDHVADAPHGVQQGSAAGIDLLAQVRDVQLHDRGLAAEVVRPHPVQDLRLRQHTALVA